MDSHPPSDRFESANEILCLALDVPPAERAGFVRRRCGNDRTLEDSILRLLKKFDDLGDFLQQPAVAALNPLLSGATLAARFRIVRKLGEGGMGEVFQAEDSVLGEAVALKLIRPLSQPDPEMEARFRSEIRLARKISHPNVCRTNDVFSDAIDGRPLFFFTMEFIEGETLAAYMAAHGPLSPTDVLDLAVQIAAGLDAAHREGIVHRDLKPANIMLATGRDGTLKPVITDFGLARPLRYEPDSGLTQTGQLLGSPGYMAPEQFLGTAITAAADVYAFALIIVEMLTGNRVFPNESLVRAAIRRATQDPPSLSQLAPGAPAAWSVPLARALSRDPAARPASAGALIRDLETARPRLHRPSRRAVLIGTSAAAAASAIAAAFRFHDWKRAKLPSEPLLMFVNAAQPGTESQNAAAFITLLSRQLERAGVREFPADRAHATWLRMHSGGPAFPAHLQPQDAREVALRGGVNLIAFTGAARKLDDWSFWVRLELVGETPAAPAAFWDREFRASDGGDRFTASTQCVEWFGKTLGAVPAANIRPRSPQELTTSNWEALTEYAESNDAWVRGNRDLAIRHLKTALDLDPEFALAAGRMADFLNASNRVDEALDWYGRAAELIRKKNLTDRESLQVRTVFALDTWQFEECEQDAARWAAEYPKDFVPLVHRATALAELGQTEAALHAADLSIALDPARRSPRMCRALTLLRKGRFAEAARDVDILAKIPPTDSTWQLKGALAVAHLDYAAAWEALDRMLHGESDPLRSSAYSLQACQRADQDRRSEAAAILQEGIVFDRERSQPAAALKKQRLLAQISLLDGRSSEARRLCKLVLAASPGRVATMEIGCVLAQAGDVAAARACLPAGLPPWPIYSQWQSRLKSEIALASGHAAEALDLAAEAFKPDRETGLWPDYLVRAAIAASRPEIAGEQIDAILTNPARYWFNADFSTPGALHWALQHADRYAGEAGKTRAAAIRQALQAAS